jgi:hypothetical protein
MIKIKKSATADSRTCDKSKVTKEVLFQTSIQHILDVRLAIEYFRGRLKYAGMMHDNTKLSEIDDFHKSFISDDFKGATDWFQMHVTSERHHLNEHVPDDVNLIDVLERISDIVMAGVGRTGKFDYDFSPVLSGEVLQKAYLNTIKMLVAQVEVEDD